VNGPSPRAALSVLMSVYHRESPAFLAQSLTSLVSQTLLADEVLIVKDGPLGDALELVINSFRSTLPIRTVTLENNIGLGLALQRGVLECRNELIARMDCDDICLPDRFQKQQQFMATRPEIDLSGACIAEFIADPANLYAVRRLPQGDADLRRWAIRRNPLNHMTVMFRKTAVLRAGNYQPMRGFEDYYLWARMLMAGSRIANLDDTLVHARCGNGMPARRGGLSYVRDELRFQLMLRRIGFLGIGDCALNILTRTPVRLMPTSLREQLYRRVLRTRVPLLAH
jgi:glycosyltransferase involved in cell wall biosynthesis